MVKKDTETSATVTRKKSAKQEDLPTIAPSDRKIQELEDLGDALADLQDEASAIREKVKDADENLVAAMRRRERTYYNRQTWGSITLKETKVSCAVKKSSATTGGDADEE